MLLVAALGPATITAATVTTIFLTLSWAGDHYSREHITVVSVLLYLVWQGIAIVWLRRNWGGPNDE